MAFNAFIFRHLIKDHAATECVDVVIRFAHGHAIKDYAYGSFRQTVWATFSGHEKKIWRGTDSDPRFCQLPAGSIGVRNVQLFNPIVEN